MFEQYLFLARVQSLSEDRIRHPNLPHAAYRADVSRVALCASLLRPTAPKAAGLKGIEGRPPPSPQSLMCPRTTRSNVSLQLTSERGGDPGTRGHRGAIVGYSARPGSQLNSSGMWLRTSLLAQ